MWYLQAIDINGFFLPLHRYSHHLDWFNDDKDKMTFILTFWFHRRFWPSPSKHFLGHIYWTSARQCIHLYSCSYKNENSRTFCTVEAAAVSSYRVYSLGLQSLAFPYLPWGLRVLLERLCSQPHIIEVQVFKAHPAVATVRLRCLDATWGYAVCLLVTSIPIFILSVNTFFSVCIWTKNAFKRKNELWSSIPQAPALWFLVYWFLKSWGASVFSVQPVTFFSWSAHS